MVDVRVIGLDIAKSIFQLHGLDGAGAILLQKRLTRARLLPFFEKLPACLVGIEACATSHYWAREIARFGHEVKLMPAQYVKPYVKRQKNDMADAEAIAEAVTRPNMRFVAAKGPDDQSAMMLHKVRLMLNRQVVMLSNAIRAHMAEFGIVAPVGRGGIDRLLTVIEDEADQRIPAEARRCLQPPRYSAGIAEVSGPTPGEVGLSLQNSATTRGSRPTSDTASHTRANTEAEIARAWVEPIAPAHGSSRSGFPCE